MATWTGQTKNTSVYSFHVKGGDPWTYNQITIAYNQDKDNNRDVYYNSLGTGQSYTNQSKNTCSWTEQSKN